ncbi:MAG: hypothetical protein AAFP03_01330 [Cyanobacteria bacterium J06598_3]
MADLIIPATLKSWLFFLFLFFLLGYPIPFSILFGAIGGVAGGLTSSWLQVQQGIASDSNNDDDESGRDDDATAPGKVLGKSSRWEIPFFGSSKAKQRYTARNQRARSRRIR